MIHTVLQLLFTVHVKRLKYIPKNENGVSIHARDCAKHFAVEYSICPSRPVKEYKIYRNMKVKYRFRNTRHS